jgi:Mg2+-importing ATPase
MPFASKIGLTPLPLVNMMAIGLILAGYILTADLLKVWFFKKHRTV